MMDELVAKKKTRSPIWQFFGFQPNQNGEPKDPNNATCRLCRGQVVAKDSSTTNLFLHLKIHHPPEYAGLGPAAPASISAPRTVSGHQPSIMGAFAKTSIYKKDSVRWRECTEAVARYLVKEMAPIRTVETGSFKKMLTTLDKQYEVPGRKFFTQKAIPELYNKVRGEVISVVKNADYYALTTDMWSSRDMTPYMSLTAHFMGTTLQTI